MKDLDQTLASALVPTSAEILRRLVPTFARPRAFKPAFTRFPVFLDDLFAIARMFQQ
jgi:hypothetical protein